MVNEARNSSIPATFLTKAMASKQFKCSRVTLDKRIRSGAISAITDSGKVYIDPVELHRVFGKRKDPVDAAVKASDSEIELHKKEKTDLQKELEKATVEIAALKQTVALIEDMRSERKGELNRALAEKDELKQELKEERNKGIFKRMFGS